MRPHALALGVGLFVGLGSLLAGGARDEALKKERKRFEGTWRVVSLEVDGNKAAEKDARKITVVNAADGKWAIEVDGKVVMRGTSVIDPAKKPKAVDLTVTEGEDKGKTARGIYEFSGDSRTVCLAPAGKKRPTEFAAPPGSGHVLAVLKRVKK
jgi:uncharacterized protein (TIGR03067 family)